MNLTGQNYAPGKLPARYNPYNSNIPRIAFPDLTLDVIINDLRVPPGNRLEALRGNRKGQHSIRINDQWWICFKWRNGSAYEVEITDYHLEIICKVKNCRPFIPARF